MILLRFNETLSITYDGFERGFNGSFYIPLSMQSSANVPNFDEVIIFQIDPTIKIITSSV